MLTEDGTVQRTGKPIHEYRGLSTDAKPEEATNGSIYLELDTGKVFAYDEENENWGEL